MGRNNKEWEPEPQRYMPDEARIEILPDERKDTTPPKDRFEANYEMGEDITPADVNESEED